VSSIAPALQEPRLPEVTSQGRGPGIIAAAIGALIAVEVIVGGLVATNVALYGLLAVIALGAMFSILRHPTAIAYVVALWILFEKNAGAHDPNLTNLLSAAGDGLLIVGLSLAIVVNLLRRNTPTLRFGPVLLGAVAFVFLGVASTIANGVPAYVATLGLLDSLRSLLMFLIVINIGISARDVKVACYWLVGFMSLAGVVGVLQVWSGSPAWALGGLRLTGTHGLMRVDGIFDHPLSLGDYLALTAPLGILLFAMGNIQGSARKWLGAGVAAMILALIFTFAREAWLAVPISIIVVGIFVERRLLKSVLPVVALLALAIAPFAASVNTADSGAQRLTLFKISLPLIRNHLLLGVGPGRWGGHVADVTNSPLYDQYHVANFFYGTGNQIDQFWTHLMTESGVLGVGAFLMMIVGVFLVGRRAYLTSIDPRRKAIILGLLCAAPSAVLLSFVSSVLEEGPASVLFWGLMGMVVVLALHPEDETVESTHAISASKIDVAKAPLEHQSTELIPQPSA
jgi:hypothetical protein